MRTIATLFYHVKALPIILLVYVLIAYRLIVKNLRHNNLQTTKN